MLNNKLSLVFFFKIIAVDLKIIDIILEKYKSINIKPILYFFFKLNKFNLKKNTKNYIRVSRVILKNSSIINKSNKTNIDFNKYKINYINNKGQNNKTVYNTYLGSKYINKYKSILKSTGNITRKQIGCNNIRDFIYNQYNSTYIYFLRKFLNIKLFRLKKLNNSKYKKKINFFLKKKININRNNMFFFKNFIKKKVQYRSFFLKTKSFFIFKNTSKLSYLSKLIKYNFLNKRTYNWSVVN